MTIDEATRVLSEFIMPVSELRGVSIYQTKGGYSVTVYTEDEKREEKIGDKR